MVKKPTKNRTLAPSAIAMNKQVLDDIRTEHANEILKRLANEDANISKRIEKLALEYLTKVDPDDIAENVFYDLNCLDVEDVWKTLGEQEMGTLILMNSPSRWLKQRWNPMLMNSECARIFQWTKRQNFTAWGY